MELMPSKPQEAKEVRSRPRGANNRQKGAIWSQRYRLQLLEVHHAVEAVDQLEAEGPGQSSLDLAIDLLGATGGLEAQAASIAT